MTQLDLFNQSPAPSSDMAPSSVVAAPAGATIICFPQRRNIAKVRHVAAQILRRAEGRQRESYWRQVCNRMAAMLAKNGIDDIEVNRQLNAFAEAVSAEMYRMCHGHDLEWPGGAA
jgi:hypothetical protein